MTAATLLPRDGALRDGVWYATIPVKPIAAKIHSPRKTSTVRVGRALRARRSTSKRVKRGLRPRRHFAALNPHNAAHASEKRSTRISSDEKSSSSARVLANVTPQTTIATAAKSQPSTRALILHSYRNVAMRPYHAVVRSHIIDFPTIPEVIHFL